ncbi:MAG: MBL fold metallo-hydrolase [Ardenticatenales bacterium]|nr:MBL fold metallo-hydrolase [Ardenticatenales bacterium]
MDSMMRIKFWGVRGSYPVPGSATLRYGGNTPCIEIRAGEHTIILDAGTGVVGLGSELVRRSAMTEEPVRALMLFSHMHHDHTQGFPFFAPLYLGTTRLTILGPGLNGHSPDDILASTMAPPNFPLAYDDLRASNTLRRLQDRDLILIGREVRVQSGTTPEGERDEDEVRIRVLRSYAHPSGVLFYRIEWRGQTVVYATDTEGYAGGDQRLATFSEEADLLIHDSQYTLEHYLGLLPGCPTTQGYGHSTPSMACAVARAANVKQLALFHFDPSYDDESVAAMERQAQGYFPNTLAAREGLEIILGTKSEQPTSRRKTKSKLRVDGSNVHRAGQIGATGSQGVKSL